MNRATRKFIEIPLTSAIIDTLISAPNVLVQSESNCLKNDFRFAQTNSRLLPPPKLRKSRFLQICSSSRKHEENLNQVKSSFCSPNYIEQTAHCDQSMKPQPEAPSTCYLRSAFKIATKNFGAKIDQKKIWRQNFGDFLFEEPLGFKGGSPVSSSSSSVRPCPAKPESSESPKKAKSRKK